MQITVPSPQPLVGTIRLPADKSLGHRALMYAAVRRGVTTVTGLGGGADVAATAEALRALGVSVRAVDTPAPADAAAGMRPGLLTLEVTGDGFAGLRPNGQHLDCGNSGTTIRLLAGLLAGRPGTVVLDGDESLRRRPMERVAAPLRAMGADVTTTEGRPPLTVRGALLTGMQHHLTIASGQVKTALLFAGLQAEGRTAVVEPGPSRDHTERALAALGVPVGRAPGRVCVDGPVAHLGEGPLRLELPGDPSSAAFLVAAALLVPGSDLVVENVCLNPGRVGAFEVWQAMGADLSWETEREDGLGEPVGRVRARTSRLGAGHLEGEQVVRAIDEIPVLVAAAASAGAPFALSGAAELRTKESDRLATMVRALRVLGVRVAETSDGLSLAGGQLRSGTVDAAGDHRMAMSLFVAGLGASVPVTVTGWDGVASSYPEFLGDLSSLGLPVPVPEVTG